MLKKIIFVLLLTQSFIAWAGDCGLKGKLAERIEDCQNQKQASRIIDDTKGEMIQEKKIVYDAAWTLVVKSGINEIRQDNNTQLVWRLTPGTELNHYDALDLCESYNNENLGLKKMKWQLPTGAQLIQSHETLRFIKRGIWTGESPSGSYGGKSSEALYVKLGENQDPQPANSFKNKNVVLCVAGGSVK